MRIAQIVVVCGTIHSFVVEFCVVIVCGFLFCGVFAFEILVVQQKEVSHATTKPHFFAVNGIGFYITFAFPIINLFIAHGMPHALFDLCTPFGWRKRKIFAYAIHGLLYGVYCKTVLCFCLFRESVEQFFGFFEFSF